MNCNMGTEGLDEVYAGLENPLASTWSSIWARNKHPAGGDREPTPNPITSGMELLQNLSSCRHGFPPQPRTRLPPYYAHGRKELENRSGHMHQTPDRRLMISVESVRVCFTDRPWNWPSIVLKDFDPRALHFDIFASGTHTDSWVRGPLFLWVVGLIRVV
ncbi:hypothetical protein BDP81DRAFT_80878 [Colletotrichum phormii]|uniref:Uncharacterized protein n=1 Tax=Colletotrichum phormii TaxID=359342 RepID=A0AAJ0A3A7_9PEZI|nr:uncharacterized protein BDP81DRAFT_80878 [Colletotrichum phormii]KAK1654296.1 hypothetical protein BDP81DRAFT_80878 [Colletotrichum phormii]